jgi:hypothetical protein
MVFESVEISTPVAESPAISWAAIAAGAVAAAALTLVLLAFGVGMGFSVVSPWGKSGVSATTFEIGTGLYLIVVAMLASTIGRLYRGAAAYEMGRRTYPRSLFSRHRSWLFGMGIRHGTQRCVFDCGGQQHCWWRIIGTCTRSQCVDKPISGIRRSGGLLCGYAVAIQSYRKTRYGRFGIRSPRDRSDLDNARKAAAKLSLWLTASLLTGAFSASLAATDGGFVRDRNASLAEQ